MCTGKSCCLSSPFLSAEKFDPSGSGGGREGGREGGNGSVLRLQLGRKGGKEGWRGRKEVSRFSANVELDAISARSLTFPSSGVEFLNMVCICHQWENERQERERRRWRLSILPSTSFSLLRKPADCRDRDRRR